LGDFENWPALCFGKKYKPGALNGWACLEAICCESELKLLDHFWKKMLDIFIIPW
jgi:hypothetical protein